MWRNKDKMWNKGWKYSVKNVCFPQRREKMAKEVQKRNKANRKQRIKWQTSQHVSIVTLNVNRLNIPIKWQKLQESTLKSKIQLTDSNKKCILNSKVVVIKRWNAIYYVNGVHKRAGLTVI